jgi:regulator of sigma E protease
MTVQTIFEFIVALVALIILHEFGHFIACKLFRVDVEEFGLGLPSPKPIVLFEAGGTKFTFNWLLLGGFVRPKGENDPSIPGGLAAASPWIRICVFLSGPLMNLLVGVLLYAMIFTRIGSPEEIPNQVQIIVPTAKEYIDSPANQAGLQSCDFITSANGQVITNTDTLSSAIHANRGKLITLTYLRDGETTEVSLRPRTEEETPEGQGATGIILGYPFKFTRLSLYAIGTRSVEAVYRHASALISLPGKLIRKQIPAEQGRLVGFKGMYDIYSSMRNGGGTIGACLPKSVNVLGFFAAITISLGLLNLMPIPALDGGQILFALPEIILRRRIPPEYAGLINGIFLLLMIGLLLFINLQDFINPFKP